MAKECTPSTGNLPPGGLPRSSIVRITGRPDTAPAVYHGREATNQIKQNALCRTNLLIVFSTSPRKIRFL